MKRYKYFLLGMAVLAFIAFIGYKIYDSEKRRLLAFEKHKPALAAFEKSQEGKKEYFKAGKAYKAFSNAEKSQVSSELYQYQRYFDSLTDIEESANKKIETFEQTVNDYINGSATLLDAYEAAERAQNAAKNAIRNIDDLEAPDLSSNELNNSLAKVEEAFSIAYRYKVDALENVKDYLNSNEIKYLHEYKKNMEEANDLLIGGGAVLAEVESKLK